MKDNVSYLLRLFFFLFISSIYLSAGVLLGDQNIESTLDSNASGRAQAFQTVANTNGLLNSLSLYVDASSTASQIAIGLYSDSGGHPAVLLTQGVFTPQAGTWNTVSVPPVSVVAGTNYWIAVLGLGLGRPYFHDTMTGCTSEGSTSSTLSALPAAWSTGGIWAACALSGYGSATDISVVAVTLSPMTVSLLPAGTQQFTATVANATNTDVTWAATGGAITPSGMYTAPAAAGAYTVTATSVADATQSASATVTVSAQGVLLGDQNVESNLDSHSAGHAEAFSVTAASTGVLSALSLYVDATSTASQIAIGLYGDSSGSPSSLLTQATFAPQAGSWNTVGVPAVPVVAGTNYWIAVLGPVDGRAVFRSSGNTCNSVGSPPNQATLPGVWSTGRPYGRCLVSAYGISAVVTPVVAVSISPTSVSLSAGGSQQFAATVTGTTNIAVSWSASGGSISPAGLYTAPSGAGTYTVTATSADDPTKSASATVAVNVPVPVSISISPVSVALSTGATQQFTASVTGTGNTAVAWSASGGSISSSGLYTAPSAAGTFTVTATSAADPTKSASATITVTVPVSVSISILPLSVSLSLGGAQQFTASVTGTSNTGVTWSASGGTISSSGLFTAPAVLVGVYTVTVTSAADTTKSASALVTVVAALQHSVTLSWTDSDSSVVGYNIYRGIVSGGPYSLLNSAVQSGTSYVDLSVQAGETYYYVITAVNSSGTESFNSSEVSAIVPSP